MDEISSSSDTSSSTSTITYTSVTSPPPNLLIKCSEGDVLELEHNVASPEMGANKRLQNDNVLELPEINPHIRCKVMHYCNMHAKYYPEQLKIWDQEFVKNESMDTLFDLIKAANHMNITSLINLSCQTMADRIKFMDVKEVREMFWEVGDFTPQQERDFRIRHRWAFK